MDPMEGSDVGNGDESKQAQLVDNVGTDTGVRTTGQGQEAYTHTRRTPKNTQREKQPGESPWMQNMFTKIYQDLRALSKDFSVPITVPELLFFGFQSSGKTYVHKTKTKTITTTTKNDCSFTTNLQPDFFTCFVLCCFVWLFLHFHYYVFFLVFFVCVLKQINTEYTG